MSSLADDQSYVLACILDPDFLARERESSQRGFSAGDLQRIGQIRGFIAKVKNNPAWEELPRTLQALSDYELDIQFFDSLAGANDGTLHLTLGSSRARQILGHLQVFLADVPKGQRGILSVLASHEGTVHLLGAERAAQVPKDASPLRAGVPRRLQHYRLTSSPVSLELVLGGDNAALANGFQPDVLPHHYLYSLLDELVRVDEVDPFTALVLASVDNSRSISQISSQLENLGVKARGEEVEAVLEFHNTTGLVEYPRNPTANGEGS